MRVIRRLAAALILLAVLVAAGLAVARQQFNRYLDAPIAALAAPRTIVVEPGSSLTRVVHQLAQEGLLQRPQWLVYGLRLPSFPVTAANALVLGQLALILALKWRFGRDAPPPGRG